MEQHLTVLYHFSHFSCIQGCYVTAAHVCTTLAPGGGDAALGILTLYRDALEYIILEMHSLPTSKSSQG